MTWYSYCCSTGGIWRKPQNHADLPPIHLFCPNSVLHGNLWWISPSNLEVQFMEWCIMQGAGNTTVNKTDLVPYGNSIMLSIFPFLLGLSTYFVLNCILRHQFLWKNQAKISLLATYERCSSSWPISPYSKLCFCVPKVALLTWCITGAYLFPAPAASPVLSVPTYSLRAYRCWDGKEGCWGGCSRLEGSGEDTEENPGKRDPMAWN